MTALMIYWNSSSVYSRVGMGAVPMFEGLNCIYGNISKEALPKDCTEGISIF